MKRVNWRKKICSEWLCKTARRNEASKSNVSPVNQEPCTLREIMSRPNFSGWNKWNAGLRPINWQESHSDLRHVQLRGHVFESECNQGNRLSWWGTQVDNHWWNCYYESLHSEIIPQIDILIFYWLSRMMKLRLLSQQNLSHLTWLKHICSLSITLYSFADFAGWPQTFVPVPIHTEPQRTDYVCIIHIIRDFWATVYSIRILFRSCSSDDRVCNKK